MKVILTNFLFFDTITCDCADFGDTIAFADLTAEAPEGKVRNSESGYIIHQGREDYFRMNFNTSLLVGALPVVMLVNLPPNESLVAFNAFLFMSRIATFLFLKKSGTNCKNKGDTGKIPHTDLALVTAPFPLIEPASCIPHTTYSRILAEQKIGSVSALLNLRQVSSYPIGQRVSVMHFVLPLPTPEKNPRRPPFVIVESPLSLPVM